MQYSLNNVHISNTQLFVQETHYVWSILVKQLNSDGFCCCCKYWLYILPTLAVCSSYL